MTEEDKAKQLWEALNEIKRREGEIVHPLSALQNAATQLRNLAQLYELKYVNMLTDKRYDSANEGGASVSHGYASVANVEKLSQLEDEVRQHSRELARLYRQRDILTP